MTPEIARLAKEAGLDIVEMIAGTPSFVAQADIRDFEMFVHLLAEECAKEVEPNAEHRKDASWGYLGGTEGVELLDAVAKAIRSKFPAPKGDA